MTRALGEFIVPHHHRHQHQHQRRRRRRHRVHAVNRRIFQLILLTAARRGWSRPAGSALTVLLLSIIAICSVVTMVITAAVLVFATRVSAGVRRWWSMSWATA